MRCNIIPSAIRISSLFVTRNSRLHLVCIKNTYVFGTSYSCINAVSRHILDMMKNSHLVTTNFMCLYLNPRLLHLVTLACLLAVPILELVIELRACYFFVLSHCFVELSGCLSGAVLPRLWPDEPIFT